MENNELNSKILKNVRNNIVVSNLEREESMRIGKKKRIISLCAVAVIFLSGSFFTVNAATDGKLVENIKEKYAELVQIKYNESDFKMIENKEEKIDGDDYIVYKFESTDRKAQSDVYINKKNLEAENLITEININEEGSEMTIKDNKIKNLLILFKI